MSQHTPVMLAEVLAALQPCKDGVYIDATFGGGGYTKAILNKGSNKVYGIDRDPDAIKRGKLLQQETNNFQIIEGCFSKLKEKATDLGINNVDGIIFDIGVSSFQLDEAERGFSFMKDGPLDMRMSQSGISAAEVINNYSEEKLADIIYYYGEDRKARRIAREICDLRKKQVFTTTGQLAELLQTILPSKPGHHPATRTFQALRIYVNDELREIDTALNQSIDLLKTGGIAIVVTFHSLEDRVVKNFFKHYTSANEQQPDPMLVAYNRNKPICPSEMEITNNSRSRSAKLRAAIRTEAKRVA